MFRNALQRAQVCNRLTWFIRGRNLWNEEAVGRDGSGDTDARRLLREPVSHGEAIMLRFAWSLWLLGGPTRHKQVTATELLGTLDGRNLRLVGSLLYALGCGPDQIDKWLELLADGRVRNPLSGNEAAS